MGKTVRQLLYAVCVVIAVLAAAPAWAANDSRAFPPDNCSVGSPFMGFTGINGSNTFCNSGQDILNNAIPACTNGQQVVKENGKFICKNPTNVPSCSPNEFLSFDGESYTCKSSGVATCGTNQVLTFNGSSYFCVNRDATIPVCAANQFLTYNGSYQCASVNTPSIPNCPSGYVVSGNGTSLYCTPTAPMSGTHAGYCAQSWGGVEQIGGTIEPAYFDHTSQGYVSGYATQTGCSCRAGYSMIYTGICDEGYCLDSSTGGTSVMYPAGVFYSVCVKN
jgi:hypothetical protein